MQQLARAANLSHLPCQTGAPPEQACKCTYSNSLFFGATRKRLTLIHVYTETQFAQNNTSGTDTPLRDLLCATLSWLSCRLQSRRKPRMPVPLFVPRDPIHFHKPHLEVLECPDAAIGTTRRHCESARGRSLELTNPAEFTCSGRGYWTHFTKQQEPLFLQRQKPLDILRGAAEAAGVTSCGRLLLLGSADTDRLLWATSGK